LNLEWRFGILGDHGVVHIELDLHQVGRTGYLHAECALDVACTVGRTEIV
jgi:hypothetical protein